jgi:hypothetical protein
MTHLSDVRQGFSANIREFFQECISLSPEENAAHTLHVGLCVGCHFHLHPWYGKADTKIQVASSLLLQAREIWCLASALDLFEVCRASWLEVLLSVGCFLCLLQDVHVFVLKQVERVLELQDQQGMDRRLEIWSFEQWV